jgi:hypothetical protein
MAKRAVVCLCAVMALVALVGGPLVSPGPVLAASGTLSIATSLHEAPDPGATVIALLPAGTIVTIDGPPVDGYYPVTAGDLSGWMRGETMLVEKDVVAGDLQGSPAPDDASEVVPGDEAAGTDSVAEDPSTAAAAPRDPAAGSIDDTIAPVEATPNAPGSNPELNGDPGLDEDLPEPALTEPGVTAMPDDALVGAADPATEAPEGAIGPAPGDAAGSALPPETSAATPPSSVAPVSETPVVDAVEGEPTLGADVTPIPVSDAAPFGPASVTTEAPILLGPGPEYGLLTTAPAGSMVEKTGHLINGYVSVQYAAVTGWAPLAHLGP